jgi:leader peptidase (prepilin peptidase)/N-methyltransferase
MRTETWPITAPPPWLALVVAPFVGSFLGVLVQRLPEGRAVVLARSRCDACGARLRAVELVPLASFLWLRGRCRTCGAPIDRFHPAVEIAAFGVALWAILAEAEPVRVWAGCLLGWVLLTLSWIDWRWMRLPDSLTLPLLVAGLLFTQQTQPTMLTDHAAAAAAGYLGLRCVAWCYRLARGREGIGQGDAKLLGAAGAWLGLAWLPLVVLFGALLGIATAAALALAGQRMRANTALPFGPPLAAAFWVLWLHGNWLSYFGDVL